MDDFELARTLWKRLIPFIPKQLSHKHFGQWNKKDLNERFRFCRYTPGQYFGIHTDGTFQRNLVEMSFFNMYDLLKFSNRRI